jgi:hypothetical protein
MWQCTSTSALIDALSLLSHVSVSTGGVRHSMKRGITRRLNSATMIPAVIGSRIASMVFYYDAKM